MKQCLDKVRKSSGGLGPKIGSVDPSITVEERMRVPQLFFITNGQFSFKEPQKTLSQQKDEQMTLCRVYFVVCTLYTSHLFKEGVYLVPSKLF